MIFNFTSAHAVEDFDFNWQKRILKLHIETHTHTHTPEKIINKHNSFFFSSAEKQFYYKYLM